MSKLSMTRIGRRQHVWNLLSLVVGGWGGGVSFGDVRGPRAKVNNYRIELRGDGLATGRAIAAQVQKGAMDLGGIKVKWVERTISLDRLGLRGKQSIFTVPYVITFEVE